MAPAWRIFSAHWRGSTAEMRRPWAHDYWERADPSFVDGPGSESFAQFMQRLQAFRDRLLRQSGFVVAVGHGQFFRAFLWGEPHGFEATPARMADYRAAEVARPMANGEVIAWQPVASRGT
ncbi:MAG: histidine phosphatase family protein [Comamonadaceae bacterium]|nr:MAG: histidine phosphatase family protein [Comamonadaceae bacterium]